MSCLSIHRHELVSTAVLVYCKLVQHCNCPVACRQWHRNQDNQLVTADAVYLVRDPQLCPNKANSWPLLPNGLTMSSATAPAPAGKRPALPCPASLSLFCKSLWEQLFSICSCIGLSILPKTQWTMSLQMHRADEFRKQMMSAEPASQFPYVPAGSVENSLATSG